MRSRSRRRDLLVGDVPVAEPRARRRDERASALGDGGIGRRLEPRRVVDRLQVLHLGGDEPRAVDVEEDLPLIDRLAEVVHGDVLDPAVVLRVDPGDLPVVVGEGADGADGLRDALPRDGLAADADALHEARVDAHRARRQVPAAVGVHRDEVHAHGRHPRPVRREGGVHGGAPVQDLAVVFRGGRAGQRAAGRRRCLARRGEREEARRPLPTRRIDGHQRRGGHAENEAHDADRDRLVHGILPILGARCEAPCFERRCIPPDCVVRRLQPPDMRPPHAWSGVTSAVPPPAFRRGANAGLTAGSPARACRSARSRAVSAMRMSER